MNSSTRASRNFLGFLIVAVGIVFLLDALDVFGEETNIAADYWPVLLIAGGIVGWAQAGFRFVLPPIIVAVVGVFLLIGALSDVDIWNYWPVLVILVGLWFIWRRSSPLRNSDRQVVTGSGSVNVTAIFGGNKQRIVGEFKGGRVTALMGGGELNLTEATLPVNGAVLDISAIMGGYEVRVPANWQVVLNVDAFMGAAEDKRTGSPAPGDDSPVLEITGTAFMGGIEVK